MKPGLRIACALGVALTLGTIAEAQPWRAAGRLRQLERQVQAQGRRITSLEGQVSSLNQTVAGLQATVAGVSSRLAGMESQLRWYSATVDCDAGGSIGAALNAAPATAPSVSITVSGTCHEAIEINRDHVTIQGQPATIEAPPGAAWGIFVAGGRDTRLDRLTVRGASTSIHIRQAHVEGSDLRLEGGVNVLMGSTVRFYSPTIIDASAGLGVDVSEESSFTVFGCQIHDAGYAGVRVGEGTFYASGCQIQRSGSFGIVAEHGANVTLEDTVIDASGRTGVVAGLGSVVLLQWPAWRNDGTPITTRIAGSPLGLEAAGGSSVRLGNVTIEGNGDGVAVSDSSVVERDMFGELRVTANTGLGVRCDPAPAVPQLVRIDASSVFGNAGGDIACTGY